MITVSALDAEGIRHAFFTREGGVSGGIFASLNCGFGSSDDTARVAENRERAAASLGLPGDRLVTCFQVHSGEAVVVERPWRRDEHPRADAMVTRIPGVALGILTADCAPVLFADAQARVIGAAHAGWRGALNGILDETVRKMQELGAVRDRIKAVIGPCIAQPSYEVGPEFPSPFLAEAAENALLFTPAARPGHFLFDLAGYAARRLNRLGIDQVDRTGGDTAAEAERFFSYRRACLRGEKDYGRELSAICLAA
ncbi:MAG TPA: peptidoglycan editing factor PgeF [Stellaceae bacterium]|nr:peptidoglycan editing factor PgeF [Stellaceae bacterium]